MAVRFALTLGALLCLSVPAGAQSGIEAQHLEANAGEYLNDRMEVVRYPDGSVLRSGLIVGTRNGEQRMQRVDRHGNVLWEQEFRGENPPSLNGFVPLEDGGALLRRHDDSPHNDGSADTLVRLDAQGRTVWEQPIRLTRTRPQHLYAEVVPESFSDRGTLYFRVMCTNGHLEFGGHRLRLRGSVGYGSGELDLQTGRVLSFQPYRNVIHHPSGESTEFRESFRLGRTPLEEQYVQFRFVRRNRRGRVLRRFRVRLAGSIRGEGMRAMGEDIAFATSICYAEDTAGRCLWQGKLFIIGDGGVLSEHEIPVDSEMSWGAGPLRIVGGVGRDFRSTGRGPERITETLEVLTFRSSRQAPIRSRIRLHRRHFERLSNLSVQSDSDGVTVGGFTFDTTRQRFSATVVHVPDAELQPVERHVRLVDRQHPAEEPRRVHRTLPLFLR